MSIPFASVDSKSVYKLFLSGFQTSFFWFFHFRSRLLTHQKWTQQLWNPIPFSLDIFSLKNNSLGTDTQNTVLINNDLFRFSFWNVTLSGSKNEMWLRTVRVCVDPDPMIASRSDAGKTYLGCCGLLIGIKIQVCLSSDIEKWMIPWSSKWIRPYSHFCSIQQFLNKTAKNR